MKWDKKIGNKSKRIILFTSLSTLAISTPFFVTSCTVEKTVISELGKVKFTLTELGKTKTPEQIEEEVNIYGTTSSGTIDVVGIKEDVLFKYVSKPKIGRNVALNIKVVKALQDDDQNEGNPYLLISYTLSKGGYTSKKQNTTLFGEVEDPSTSDKEEVNALVEALKNKKISAKSGASQVLPSSITAQNVWTYVDGDLKNYVSSDVTKLRVLIKTFNHNDDEGSLSLSYVVKSLNYESILINTNVIKGFKTNKQQSDQEEVETLVEILKNEQISAKTDISGILPSSIKSGNIWTYINAELQKYILEDETKVRVVLKSLNHDDEAGYFSISYIVKKNNYESEMIETNTIQNFQKDPRATNIVSNGLQISKSGTVISFSEGFTTTNLNIKSEYWGIKIRKIAEQAFYGQKIRSVILPNSVSIIEANAFTNNRIETVVLPDSLQVIAERAFFYNEINSLVIPNSVTYIGAAAFYNNKTSSLTLSNSLTTIEEGAFVSHQLTSLVIPESVTFIGDEAFSSYNNKLTFDTIIANPKWKTPEELLRIFGITSSTNQLLLDDKRKKY